jgi:hypothetical protein
MRLISLGLSGRLRKSRLKAYMRPLSPTCVRSQETKESTRLSRSMTSTYCLRLWIVLSAPSARRLVSLLSQTLYVYAFADMTLGCPIANVPLGRYNLKGKLSRPYGLAVLGKLGGEGNIFRFMAAYEANFPTRVIPKRLLCLSTLA